MRRRSSSFVVVLCIGEFASLSSSHRCPRIARLSPLSLVVAWSRIYYRIGWPVWYGLIMAVPFVNVVFVVLVAFSKWPIEQRMEAMEQDLKGMHGEL